GFAFCGGFISPVLSWTGQVALATLVREALATLACDICKARSRDAAVQPTKENFDLTHCSALDAPGGKIAVGAAARDASRSDRDHALHRRAYRPRARGLGSGARASHDRPRLPEPVAGGELLEVDAASPRRGGASARV